jgi:hypothetical protein
VLEGGCGAHAASRPLATLRVEGFDSQGEFPAAAVDGEIIRGWTEATVQTKMP